MDGTNPPRSDRADPAEGPRPDSLETRPTADGSLTLFDPEVGQTFHSGRGAVAEARHVYLDASGALGRLARGDETRVVEIGLGAGLNLLLTADAALASGATLHYRALERRPTPTGSVRALDPGRHLAHPELAEAWLDVLATLEARSAERGVADDAVNRGVVVVPEGILAPGVTLEVALGDGASGPGGTPGRAAATMLEPGWAHAIFHDAFSPAASPELWSDAFLGACARALAPDGAWTSYSVAGAVRRRLTKHGLEVSKLHGPEGGKREMTRAVRPKESACGPTASPTR